MRPDKLLTKQEVVIRINDLLANGQSKLAKYERDYCLYNQTNVADLRARIPYVVGYNENIYSNVTKIPKVNIVKSVVDTIVSKMTTAHCRPYVNTVKGSFKTIQICKQLQIFYDYYFDENNIQAKIGDALRDACVFDSGYIYIDEKTGKVYSISPWNMYTRANEKDEFKSAFIDFPNRSIDDLSDDEYDLLKASETKDLYVSLSYFYDGNTKTKAILVNRQVRVIESLQSSEIPVVAIHYMRPVSGNSTVSVADMLDGFQYNIDNLMRTVAEASKLNPALLYFVNNAANIKLSQFNNGIGNIVQYNTSDGSLPVTAFSNNFVGDQYVRVLDDWIEKSYNMVGISQLSAQSRKPAGLDSGVALATMNDLESDRFQVILDQYIQTFVLVAKKIVKVFMANKDIIKPNRYSLPLTWGDVSKEFDKMRIQFTAADNLSKDPSEKLKQLQSLAQAGIIPASQIASLLELPDINRGYSVANNAFNATMTLIDQCIYENKYEIPTYVPFEMLKEQIVNMQLSLRAAGRDGSNDKDIEKLIKYYDMVEDKEADLEEGAQDQAVTQNTDNNMYSAQNNENFGNGTEDELNMSPEGVANPMDTSAANNGELAQVQ